MMAVVGSTGGLFVAVKALSCVVSLTLVHGHALAYYPPEQQYNITQGSFVMIHL